MAAVSEGRGEPPRSTGGAIRALAAGCIGNFVEWYDFARAPAIFLLPETRGYDLLRGADRAQTAPTTRPEAT